jgi:hypothetical protein
MDTNELCSALRGPVTLITIGSLFAIDHFTRFGFERTWPALLIVFGAMSLLCHSAGRSAAGGRR